MIRTWDLLATEGLATQAESLIDLVSGPGWRIEWIVSRGQVTAPGEWYDQDDDEWVLVLAGAARLQVEGESDERTLTAGQAIWLPAHVRHRITWTHPDRPTVWCAVFATVDPVDRVGAGP